MALIQAKNAKKNDKETTSNRKTLT